MKQFLKYIYRILYGVLLRKNKVFVSYSTLFNSQTQWGGYNKVGNKTVISSSSIGKYSFIGANGYLPNVSIGNFCSIGNNVHVVAETLRKDLYQQVPYSIPSTNNAELLS